MKRKTILTILSIIVILILGPTFLLRKIKKTSAAWFNDGWGYRKAVNITNSSGSVLADFQVNIGIGTSALIAQGKMPACIAMRSIAGRQSNCNDIRITDTI